MLRPLPKQRQEDEPGMTASPGTAKSLRYVGFKFGAEPGMQSTRFGYFLEQSAVLSALLFYAKTCETMAGAGPPQRGFEAGLASA